MTSGATHGAIEAVWRIESPRLIGGLARMTGDVGLAEDLAQDALVAALEPWPSDGVPNNPGAWLMTTAKRRGIDTFRRNERLGRKQAELAHQLETSIQPGLDAGFDDEVADRLDDELDDDLLRLIFTCCHPVLAATARVALTLRVLGGLSTEEIARAFLLSEATVAQRIVRAKRTLAKAEVPFEVPSPSERPERLASVLEVIYLIFNEGYSATAGDDWMRPTLCAEALRLGRILAGLAPAESEVHGLVALMEIQASRTAARTAEDGTPILLLEQNRRLWDQLLIRRGFAAIARAQALGRGAGPYLLQAELAACHARAHRAEETDWLRIVTLYEQLGALTPSPVVELNRAVAVGMSGDPGHALQIVDQLVATAGLNGYHLLPSVRGDLLARLGRFEEAGQAFSLAATQTRNTREQAMLRERAASCAARSGSGQ
ncbi:RNA polymerase ECF family sigma subunit [Jatrophihabitans sp. GAS493]|uniref:RNA polymerase sigma factor n=1 Tax=Jatrophihabitans sp. GAS493 TaxID=1907575 RepID=UPI000BB8BFFB|nr:RNA polymerase sigma factor [Jatrophihabitans sp. GAS493]SOD71408.1 RNA polymerase ECF family sigma subunit [Jatrophihabitans sp. GAS493]